MGQWDALKYIPEKQRNQWGWKRPLRSSSPSHGWALHGLGQIPPHPCMTLLNPHREEQKAILTFPSHPNTSGPKEPPGIFPVTPQIFYNRKSCSKNKKKSSLATFPEYSHFRPSRNAGGTTLLRERWVFVSWLEHRVRWSGAVGSHSSLATESFWELC